MNAYYNDNDPFCAEWLRRLIAARVIPGGYVDERSIAEVESGDLGGFAQCHFFAGIGGWAYALQLAGWPDDRPVWTGSCPCQPLSSAGQRRAHADERHLWPAFYELIAECRPPTVFGEQVASKLGREWLSGVRVDLEHLGYALGGADLPAACVGAPHIRQRIFWVADAAGLPSGGLGNASSEQMGRTRQPWQDSVWPSDSRMGNPTLDGCREERADARGRGEGDRAQGSAERSGAGFWSDAVWLQCLDGKARRIEPSIQPLATGIPNRVGLLRGSGNSIVPQAAAVFVTAVMECIP